MYYFLLLIIITIILFYSIQKALLMKKYKDIAFEEYKKVLNKILQNSDININNLISNK